jgi:uncharacterized protein YbbC (DUF1343 family)
MNANKILFPLVLILLPFLLQAQAPQRIVKTGLQVLKESNFAALKGKKVGLITNPTGVDEHVKSTVDLFYQSPQVELVALFGPEHGVRGNYSAGKKISNKRDPLTGIPVYSLYGNNKKPAPHMLRNIDVLVYDIQDIGVRSYTYISTMGLAMEAAAENDIEFMVLDRPNPLGGNKMEGNIAEEKIFSLVGAFPIPYVYGLTVGELAKMINEEGWLAKDQKCELTVIEMQGWYRNLHFEDCNLPWVPSSPHIPHAHLAPYYVATGILGELGFFNIGVGYTLPFELLGAEFINPYLLAESLNNYYQGKVIFRPLTYTPYYGSKAKKLLHGLQIYIIEPETVSLMSIQFKFLEVFHKIYPNVNIPEEAKDRMQMFDKVCGSAAIREAFFASYRYRDIEDFLNKDLDAFRKKARKYFLYE